MALYLDVGPDDALRLGTTLVYVERKSGTRVRLRIEGDAKVELLRKHRDKSAAPLPATVPGTE